MPPTKEKDKTPEAPIVTAVALPSAASAPPVTDPEAPTQYEVKHVRAIARGYDGFKIREPGDEFAMKIFSRINGGVVKPPSWVTVVGDAPESAVERLLEASPDPAALPGPSGPPATAAVQGAPQQDAGVL